jgi:hypothetical protein
MAVALLAAAAGPAASAPRKDWTAACAGTVSPRAAAAAARPAPPEWLRDVLPPGVFQGDVVQVGAADAGHPAGTGQTGTEEPSSRLAALVVPAFAAVGPGRNEVAASWAGRSDVTIIAVAPADRWGRAPVLVLAEGDLLNAELLRAGLALFRSGDVPIACARLLQAEEDVARRARRGIWAREDFVLAADRPLDILAREGRFTLVEGRVRSVGQTKTRVYLNFGTVRSQDFAISVEKRNLRKFEASGMTGTSWEGRRIRVRGIVVQAGGPLIEVSSPEDVERLE